MKLTIDHEVCEAVRCTITQSEERISSYLLNNGTVVKVRCILTGVWCLPEKLDLNGQPVYHLNWHVITTTEQGD